MTPHASSPQATAPRGVGLEALADAIDSAPQGHGAALIARR